MCTGCRECDGTPPGCEHVGRGENACPECRAKNQGFGHLLAEKCARCDERRAVFCLRCHEKEVALLNAEIDIRNRRLAEAVNLIIAQQDGHSAGSAAATGAVRAGAAPVADQAQPRPPAGSNWSDAIASGLWAGVDMVVVCSAALMGAIAVSFFLGKIK